MATITSTKSITQSALIKAGKMRVAAFPPNWKKLHYSDEAGSLFVQVSDEPISNSTHDFDKDVVFNFNQQGKIVSFEILDLFSVV
jgi:uncharacterized protein YuzE